MKSCKMSSIKGKKATCFYEVTKYVSAYHVSNLTWKTPYLPCLHLVYRRKQFSMCNKKTIIRQTKGKTVVCTPHSQRYTELDLYLRNVRKGVKSFTLRNIND